MQRAPRTLVHLGTTKTHNKENRVSAKPAVDADVVKQDYDAYWGLDTKTEYPVLTRTQELVKELSRFKEYGGRNVGEKNVLTAAKRMMDDPRNEMKKNTTYHVVAYGWMLEDPAWCCLLTTDQWRELCRGDGANIPLLPPTASGSSLATADGGRTGAVFGATIDESDEDTDDDDTDE